MHVSGYFYISSYYNFYKTDINFNLIASYNNNQFAGYSSIYYDSTSSLFYVTSSNNKSVSVFDTNCNLQKYTTLGGYNPQYTLSYFNGNLYGDIVYDYGTIVVATKATGTLVAKYKTICSSLIPSLTFDSFGYMAVGCWDGLIYLYNATNVTYLNLQLTSSRIPSTTAVDASGRFLSISSSAIDIYY